MIFNVTGGGGGTGCTLTITAPVGATVTVSKNGKAKPSKVATTGTVVFKGLETGTWTITITNGTDTATKTVEIKADYSTEITFFSAIINITYPPGLTCKATNGSTVLTAPDTSGTWACTVNKAGTWTVSLSNGLSETVTIAATGESHTVNKWYLLRDGVANQTYKFGEGQLRSGMSVSVTSGDGVLVCKPPKSNESVGVATLTPLNLTGFTKMSAEYSGGAIRLGGYTALNGGWNNSNTPVVGTAASAASGTVDVNVADNTDELYVGIGWKTSTIKMSNLWLEV